MFRDKARAALTAALDCMMEPSGDMAEVGHQIANKLPDGRVLAVGFGVDVYEVWQAMLSQLRKEILK